jgi:hypothetical protein
MTRVAVENPTVVALWKQAALALVAAPAAVWAASAGA